MATPERGSVQRNLPSTILGWTGLLRRQKRFKIYSPQHTRTNMLKQIGRRGPGRTVTPTSQCDKSSRWSGILGRKQPLCKGDVKAQYSSSISHADANSSVQSHTLLTTPAHTQTPDASLHWQVSRCPCRQTSMKDAQINSLSCFLLSHVHVNAFCTIHYG